MSALESNKLVLRDVSSTSSGIGRKSVSLRPEQFIKILEDSTQWNSTVPRTFDVSEKGYEYCTRRFDSYDITNEVREMLKNQLVSIETITSDAGFENLRITFDAESNLFSVEIEPDRTLKFLEDDHRISDLKHRIRENRLKVNFSALINWSIEDQRYLKARLSFGYLKQVQGKKGLSCFGIFSDPGTEDAPITINTGKPATP